MVSEDLLSITGNAYIPKICPTAVIVGSVYENLSSYLVYGPLFGETWQRAMNEDKNAEFWASKVTGPASLTYGTSLIASGIQAYAMSALLKLTGCIKYKSAICLSSLVFAATSLPSLVTAYFVEKRPKEYVFVKFISGITQTVGLGLVLTSYHLRWKM